MLAPVGKHNIQPTTYNCKLQQNTLSAQMIQALLHHLVGTISAPVEVYRGSGAIP